ncbi:Putative protein of unknown function [Podospora comata]|uniref:J domain-containing protein n=1 Tax=Podospora comata TaxID=48703 RepID=A0ABY6RTQ1_PODCO|nr:Putative protein of unknown function [Podospora comata]
MDPIYPTNAEPAKPDYYFDLGFPTFDDEHTYIERRDIKAAWLKMIKRHHPDKRGPGNDGDTVEFRRLMTTFAMRTNAHVTTKNTLVLESSGSATGSWLPKKRILQDEKLRLLKGKSPHGEKHEEKRKDSKRFEMSGIDLKPRDNGSLWLNGSASKQRDRPRKLQGGPRSKKNKRPKTSLEGKSKSDGTWNGRSGGLGQFGILRNLRQFCKPSEPKDTNGLGEKETAKGKNGSGDDGKDGWKKAKGWFTNTRKASGGQRTICGRRHFRPKSRFKVLST